MTRFFQLKAIPAPFLNARNYVLQFISKRADIDGSNNTAAYFLSRLDMKVTEVIRLKIWEDVQTTPIEMTTSFSDVADEEQLFFEQPEEQMKNGTFNGRSHLGKKATDWVANE